MRIPLIPTVIVSAAIAVMMAAGIWQLGRAEERDALKLAMISRPSMPIAEYPFGIVENEEFLYRRLRADCERVVDMTVVGGKDAYGRTGWKQIATCQSPSGSTFDAQIGIARLPDEVVAWSGGRVEGGAVPSIDKRGFWERLTFQKAERSLMIVAAEPKVGLLPSAIPDPEEYKNTSWAYAGQWFFFAITALVIYILALRRRSTRARPD